MAEQVGKGRRRVGRKGQQTLRERLGKEGPGEPQRAAGSSKGQQRQGKDLLLECKVAVRRATPASLNGPARDKEQGRALCGAPSSAPQGSAGSLPPLPRQVRSALKKRWHRWQDHHSLRVPVARAMSIPTSPTRISFHSIKQTAAV